MGKAKIKSTNRDLQGRILTALNHMRPKKADKGTFIVGRSTEESPTKVRYLVTTGIRAFDDRVGGMPVGKTIELIGMPQSGKTNMAVRTCVRAQMGHIYERVEDDGGKITLKKLKPGTYDVTTMYYDNEGSLSDFDKRRVDGVLMDGLIIPCDTVELLWKTMDRVIVEVDKEEEETGRLQILIVVIDTVGIMSTAMEMEKEFGKIDYPRVPKQLKDGFKRMTGKMMRENVLLIGLNHVSKKLVQGYKRGPGMKGWEYQQPGGLAFSYCSFHQVYFETLQVKYRLAKRGSPDGYLVYFCAMKNRIMPPLRECRMALLFTVKNGETQEILREGGFNDELSILEALIYDKAAEIKKDGTGIVFRFSAFGVETTTFSKGESTPSLEEQDENDDDDGGTSRKRKSSKPDARPRRLFNPRISTRGEWHDFYAEHKADLDALYDRATQAATCGDLMPSKGAFPEDEDEADEDNELEP